MDPSRSADGETGPVFVVGVGRSGTSLIQSMLHAHPEIAVLPETHFFRKYLARPLNRWRHELAGAEAFRRTLLDDDEYQRVEIPAHETLIPFLNGGRALDLCEVYTRLLRLYRVREETTVVGEKDPRLIDYLPKVKRAFPDARIVHIVRDPRDVLLSRRNAEWSSGRPDWIHALTYHAQITRGRTDGRRTFGEGYMEIRYEDLVMRPEETLRAVAEHVGVGYTDAMLAFQESAEALVGEKERDWKAETTGPLLQDNTEKWRGRLSPWQIRLTERACAPAFDWFGYETAGEDIGLSRAWEYLLRIVPITGKGFEYAYSIARHFR